MARRVLIVSPHFPPVNAPDHQRVRMSLPYFQEYGWTSTVLTVRPDAVENATLDESLNETIPADVEVIRIQVLPVALSRRFGSGSLALRALPSLWWSGCRLLRRAKFDLVYFSTTLFPVMGLGPYWKKRFNVPYVLDFQDPWLDEYYHLRKGIRPPGGRLRYGFNQFLAKTLEPSAVRGAAHIIAVSPAYAATLSSRYAKDSRSFTTLPFGAPNRDFYSLPSRKIKQAIFDPRDGLRHWIYVGRCGEDMAPALHLLFFALQQARQKSPERWERVRLHFVGTSYAPIGKQKETVLPLALSYGLGDIVTEQTRRVPYLEALQLLSEAQAILLIGSDSPSYSASKLYPAILADKPLLSILHEESPATQLLRQLGLGPVVSFDPDKHSEALEELEDFELCVSRGEKPATDWAAFERDHSERAVAWRQCQIFDQVVAG